MSRLPSRTVALVAACLSLGTLLLSGGEAFAQSPPPSSSCDEEVQEGCGESTGNLTGETSATTAQQQATVIRGQVGNAVRSRLLDIRNRQAFNQQRWVAGTDSDSIVGDIAAWANYSYRYTDMAPPDQMTRTNLHSGTMGMDVSLWGNVILGLSLSASDSASNVNSSLPFGGSTLSEVDQRTHTISPYIGVVITDNLYMNAALGYSGEHVVNEIRTQFTDALVSRFQQDGDTRFGFIDLTYVRDWQDWTFSATTGVFRSLTRFGDTDDEVNVPLTFAAQQSDATVWNIGVQANYNYKDNFFPYVALAYEKSLTDRRIGLGEGQSGLSGTDLQTDDRNNLRLTLGVDWVPETIQSLVVSVEGDAVAGRRDYGEIGAMLNVRHTF